MSTRKRLLIVVAIGLFALLGETRQASAAVAVVSPWNTASTIWIANVGTSTWAFFVRDSDGACASSLLGTNGTLTDNFKIYGGSGNDTMFTRWYGGTICGNAVSIPVYGARWVDLYGAGGNDMVWNMVASAYTYVYGGEGNDSVMTMLSHGAAIGDNGNDKVQSQTSGGGETLLGGFGVDCLYDTDANAAYFNCGPDFDFQVSGGTPPMTFGCEQWVSTCG